MARARRKLFYKIGEVCSACGIEPHVLRYWETEFKTLAPTKNKSGQRIYREKDVRLIQTIKHLLYEEGYTIAGANKKLLSEEEESFPLLRQAKPDSRRVVSEIKRELREILKILSDDQS